MNISVNRLRSSVVALLWALCFFGILYLQYHFRIYDDSRFTSWQDVFSIADPIRVAWAVAVALVVALLIAGGPFDTRDMSLPLFLASIGASAWFWREPEMIVDAARYFVQAKHLELYGPISFIREWGNGINAWTDLPAVPFMYGIAFSLFGEARTVVQVMNSVLFASSVVLTFWLGKELWDRRTGFWAACLLLGAPYLYTQVPLMLVDVPCLFLLLLAVYAFLRALRRGGSMLAAASVAIFLSFFSKYSAWLMLSIVPIIYGAELWGSRKNNLDRVAFRGLIVFFCSFFLISLMTAYFHDTMVKQIHLLLTFQGPGLRRWGESFPAIFLFQVHPAVSILAILSVFHAMRKRDASYIAIAWLVFLAIALQIRRIRYLISILPMLSLMAAYGLTRLRDDYNPHFIAISTALTSVAIAGCAFLPFLGQMSPVNIQEAAAYLDSLDAGTVDVITPRPRTYVMNPAVVVPLLDLYLKKNIRYQYKPDELLPPEDYEISPLRFTWTYRNPGYYEHSNNGGQTVIAVISDNRQEQEADHIAQDGVTYHKSRSFTLSDSIYEHQIGIFIYN